MKETDKAIDEQLFDLGTVESLENYLFNNKTRDSTVPSPLGLKDPVLSGLILQYNSAQFSRKQLLDAKIPPDNPSVKAKASEAEKLRLGIMENLKNIKSSYNTALNESQKKSGMVQSQIEELPVRIKEYAERKRQVESRQTLFDLLQQKRLETALSKASTTSSSKIIDGASASSVPIKPNRRTIQLLAILLGLALPAIFIFIGEILNDKITTRYDIEKITATPILGEIGHSYANRSLIVDKTTRSMVGEQFRTVRSNLQYILNKTEKPVILVTSSLSGEGKSFISVNLGGVMALAGKKTIILEFDIRKPKILAGLNIPKRPGVTNFLVGKATIEELITQVPDYDNLYVLGCGPVPPNPAELLLDQKVTDLFVWLRQHFDVVIVDTAPVGMVSDAMTLSKFADCTLYLARQGHTFKKQVALIDEFYRENKLPKVSIVLNDVKLKAGYGYYGYGRYGYGYGYGYGSYFEEETPKGSFIDSVLSWFSLRRWRRLFRKK
jgi:tyrosine-protein kinase Etk/Wzc